MVEPLMMSTLGVEERLEQQKYGDEPSGGSTALLPSMDSIDKFLTGSHAAQQAEMIRLLGSIDIKLNEKTGTQTIDAQGGGRKPMSPAGVEMASMSSVNPNWDLTFGDQSAGEITAQGTG
jgi:hypothetical protein